MSKKKIMFGIVFVTSIFLCGFIAYLGIILFGNYAIDNKELVMNAASTVETADGDLISRLYFENRDIVPISDIPEHVQQAFIAVEDHRFYSHQGIDFRAIGRALYRDIVAGSKVEGGSTITQQLAKNVFLTHEKTWLRKTKEVLIAINLENRYSKDEILEMYLNRIYFGHGAHGVQAASKLYFDKHISELTIDEGALLAALPKAPNFYSPMRNPEQSENRRNLVLSLMERRGFLTAEEAVRFQGRMIPTEFARVTDDPAYLSYIDLVLDEGERLYNISRDEILKGGYRIVVEMDPHLQKVTYDVFQDSDNFPASTGQNPVEGSIVLLDHRTGGVVAVQGGRDYVQQGFHRALANRQPGSVFKPLAVFAPALESGNYHPYSLLKDELIDYNGYTPRNYNHQYAGEMSMYDAVKDSANAPAVWLLDEMGIDKGLASLRQQNIPLTEDGLAIALGGLHEGVSPLKIAAAYGTFASGGVYRDPYFIKEIYDRHGNLVAAMEQEEVEVFSPQTAWYMTRMLEAAVNDGTGASGMFDGPLAGKTGTTSFEAVSGANRDIWFAGFTPELSGAVWMGYDRTDKDHYLTAGSSVPTKLFKRVLTEAYGEVETQLAFTPPMGVNDLEAPIQFVSIEDLTADVSLGWRGATVLLQWSGSQDDRLHYRIYEKNETEIVKVGEVVGDHEYKITGQNIFSQNAYVVIPFNPQIEREGSPSNVVEARFRLFSQDDKAS